MEISIIIPVFNAEKYLSQCINSILCSKIDLEIWLIDDGSTDNSWQIIRYYAGIDSRIKTHRFAENHGQPAQARNWAIQKAQGRFIAFIDADDFIESELLKRSLEILHQEKIDILYSAYKIFADHNPEKYTIWNFPEHKSVRDLSNCFSPEEVSVEFWRELNSGACYKIYRREFLYKFELKFAEYHFEDLFFSLQSFLLAGKIYYLNQALYNYRYGHNSRSQEQSYNRLRSGLAGVYHFLQWLKNQSQFAKEVSAICLFRQTMRWLQYNLPVTYQPIYIQNLAQILQDFPPIEFTFFHPQERLLFQNLQSQKKLSYAQIRQLLPLTDALHSYLE